MHSSRGKRLSDGNVRRAADGLRRVVQVLRLSTHAIEKQHGVSGAQLFVLQQLVEKGAVSMSELADRTRTDPSSVSVVVSRLAKKGLVRIKRAADDRRRAEISLAPRGRRLLDDAPEPAQSRLVRALETLPAREITVLGRGLDRLARALGASPGAPAMFFENEKSAAERSDKRA